MKPVRVVVEYLLLGAFVAARAAFVLQALAFGAAAAAAWMATTGARPGWLIQAEISAGALSAVLLITGLLLPIARRWEQPDARAAVEASAVWPVPLGVTLLLLAGLAAYAATPLPPLWREIAARMNESIAWGDLSRPAPNSGIVVLPILIGLLVPAIVTLAAVASIALPLALLILLPDRRPRFLALFGMSTICQTGLALASWLAARMIARLIEAAAAVMRDSGDAEVLQVAERLTQASAVVAGTAFALLAPASGLVLWLLVLRPWQHAPEQGGA